MALRFLAPWFIFLFAIFAAPQVRAQDPAAFVNEFSQKGITDILAAEIPEKEKQDRFRTMFDQYFDIPQIGRFVLGRYWRLTSDEQKQNFGALFEDVIVLTWSRRFSEYNGQTLKVMSTVPDGKKGAIVKTEIFGNDGATIDVDWRLRTRNPGYQVVDVIVEGVSMAITYRQEYSTVITRNGGFEGLLNEMQEQVTRQEQPGAT
jgi:phospholipid transport system substrate-binding protein